MAFLLGSGEEEFVVFTHLAVIIPMKQWRDLGFSREFGLESRDFSGVILGTMVDMIRYLRNKY
jgi:hypothetical protein